MKSPGDEERREFEAWARQDFETGADLTETFEIRHVNGVRLNHASDWRIWQAARASLPAQPIRVCCCGECGPLEPEQPWTEEELAEAIARRQVILRIVDGGTNIGTMTPADAAMLARVALAGPGGKP